MIFNIFPLIYSLGFSFTQYRASLNKPAEFVGLQNYAELLADPGIWSNFTITAEYVVVSVAGQMIVGFGLALLLNRPFPLKGLVTTLLLLPMMLSPAVVGLFWKLFYDPSWGPNSVTTTSRSTTAQWASGRRIRASRSRRTEVAPILEPTSDCAQGAAASARAMALRSTSKMTAVDHPYSNTPFIAAIGPSNRQRSTGTISP